MEQRPPSRRVLLVAFVVVASAITGATVGFAFDGGSLGRATRAAPTLPQIQALLARHGTAVMSRSSKRFMAGIDGDRSDAAFRAAQLASFDNLASVPVASWNYRAAAPVTDPAANNAATAHYGAPAQIMRVDFSYSLRDVDPAPASYPLYLTFVDRGGQVLIASDSDLTDEAGASWHGPWDFGPVDVYRGRYSLVLAHPDEASLMPRLAAVVDAAVPAVSSVWGTGWNREIAVIVPSTPAEMNQVISDDLLLSQIAATTYANGMDAGAGQALGVRIAVNPANLSRLDAVGLRIVLRHEVTLVATWASRGPSSPLWLTEGFAEYVANLGTGQTLPVAASELAKEVREGTIPAALPTTADFDGSNARLPQSYEEAWLACRLIAATAGQAALVSFVKQVGASPLGAEAAVAAGLKSVLKMTPAQFTVAWQHYLGAELR
ncbi:MAG TPA: hypothetical protein VK816_04950 [Jatrophihabitantaceae bacterium]|jgi:hypothetical protein|nr:hypothetical protein [Jatrophihabitantaceae bacterium]